MINGLFHQQIQGFMSQHKIPAGMRLFVSRGDGLLIWDSEPNQQSQSLAALACGVWEAAMAMALAAGKNTTEEFRFNFETSEQGVLIFCVQSKPTAVYLAAVYDGCLSPGLLKRQVRVLGQKVSRFIEELPRHTTRPAPKREGYLFSDISDEEMDRLFGL
jgi:hypothetical protein